MKNSAAKAFLLIVYIVLLTRIMDFRLGMILNVPYLVVVLTGAFVLALLSHRKGTGKAGFVGRLKTMALVSGGVTAFFANVAFVSGSISGAEELYRRIIQNFLPLFYGFVYYFIADLIRFPPPEGGKPEEDGGMEKLEEYDLTRREIAVAREIINGLSNAEIAERLFISENTVKKHINHLFQKVGVRNRTELIAKFKPERQNRER